MMKYTNSTASISSLVSTHSNSAINSSFEELVSKLFSCNIVLVLTDNAKNFVKNCFGTTTFANILNQYALINNLHLTIRDLNGHNAYALNKIRFRFFDVDQFKNRPNGAQLKKLHSDIISSMSNTYLMQNDNEETGFYRETPWYDMWKNVFIDTFEPSGHDFIGTNCGCFFVISKSELPQYKVIFERLCASVKQNTTLRFIQSDFVRYFIVLSDQILEPLSPNADEFTKTCQSMKLDFPNSFVFYIDINNVSISSFRNAFETNETIKQTGDETTGDKNAINPVDFNNENQSNDILSDPLSVVASSTESNRENSKIYQEVHFQRKQSLNANSSSSSSLQSRDIINDWLSHLSIHDHLKEVLDSVSETIDFMLREFISKFLVPWAEKQIKFLGELIAQRRGFRKSIFNATKSLLNNMSSSTSLTASLTKSLAGTSGSGVIYIPDAQEMQQRKLADICMIFSIYEMAHTLYYGARKDFQSESAWIYYAGASEMSAISSYFLHKYQHNHMEQAIITYIDLCRSVNLATRATILASELLCQLNRFNEAAHLFIRMTGDDSDLRSALFLEQASKCYLSVSPKLASLKTSNPSELLFKAIENSSNSEEVIAYRSRYRKAAFHYILAGHRYNRCGLKHFALFCYRRYSYPRWESASDHVNLTVAKLFLSIASSNNRKHTEYYREGLEIFRRFSHKQTFFDELLRELKKCFPNEIPASDNMGDHQNDKKELCLNDQPAMPANFQILDIPYINNIEFLSPDSILVGENSLIGSRKLIRTTCYVGEEVHILITVVVPFDLNISKVCLITEKTDAIDLMMNNDQIDLKTNEKTQLTFKFSPKIESEFHFIGFEYCVDGLNFKKYFNQREQNCLAFVSIKTAPLIIFDVHIPEFGLSTHQCPLDFHQPQVINIPEKVYETEMITLNLTFKTLQPLEFNSIQLSTNVKDFYLFQTDNFSHLPSSQEKFSIQYMITDLSKILSIKMQIPPNCSEHTVYFRLVYSCQDGRCRTVYREIHFEVVPCFQIEMILEQVITLHNLNQNESLALYDVTIGDLQAPEPNHVLIPKNFSAHVLRQKPSISWVLFGRNNQNRCGKINITQSTS